jgi:hypothetical protein
MRPDTITAAQVDHEANAEVRRVMVERMGEARYLEQSGAALADEGLLPDGTWGWLYRREFPDDEPLCMVKVVNATVERDGTRKEYWLGVPADCRTVVEAVAWTFDLSVGDYLVAAAS